MCPINVLYIIDKLNIGGSQSSLLELVKHLNRGKFNPVVCSLGQGGYIADEMKREGIYVEIMNLRKVYNFSALKAARGLMKMIREKEITIVHTYLPSSNVYGGLVARLAGVKKIVTSRRDMGFSRSRKLGFLEELLVNPTVYRVIAVCEAVKEVTVKEWFLSEQKVVTINNGVDIREFAGWNKRDSELVKRKLGIKKGEKVVCLIAHFTPIKGHIYFFDSAAKVSRDLKGTKFLLIGDGPLRNRYTSMIKEMNLEPSIIFCGSLAKRDLLNVVHICDVGVLSSLSEGMSMSLLEFMAMGKPLVVTDVGGNGELVIDGKTGFLTKPKDSNEMAQAIVRILEDDDLADMMGKEAYRKAVEEFDIRKSVRKVEKVYGELMDIQS